MKIIDKIAKGQDLYFKSDLHEAALRSTGEGTFVKFAGKTEFLAKQGSEVVTDALLEDTEISKSEYEAF